MSRLFSWLANAVYLALIFVALPWIVWSAVRHGKYREGFAEKLLGRVPRREGEKPCVWLHAVSVGEVNLLQTTLTDLGQRLPDADFVVSTTTKTGYDLARRKYAEHTVCYCPLDFSWAVDNALRRLRPDLLVLAELELWPNLIRTASRHGTKVAIINGRLSDNSFRGYQRIRPIVQNIMRSIALIAAQNEETAERFRLLGARNVVVSGSLKFDGANTNRDNPATRKLRELAAIDDDEVVLLAGSTQAPEEQYAIDTFRTLQPDYDKLRLILVPRHPERFDEVARLLDESGLPWLRRSQLDGSQSAICNPQSAILLVDTIGELGAWWGTASIGLVGGSFGKRGGQNMLEPAAYGVATCFGPQTRNFRDIVSQLLAADAAQVVNDREELQQFVERALTDRDWANQLGRRARELVLAQQGATLRTIDLLLPLIAQTRDQEANQAA